MATENIIVAMVKHGANRQVRDTDLYRQVRDADR